MIHKNISISLTNLEKKKKRKLSKNNRITLAIVIKSFSSHYKYTTIPFLFTSLSTPTTTTKATTMAFFQRIFFLSTLLFHLFTISSSIGINYGTLGNNLPPPAQVANFIKTRTIFDSVKIFDTNPDVLRAFANTGIFVTVTVGNGDIPALADLNNARQWVANNIVPFYPQTRFLYIAVGNEIFNTGDNNLIFKLVPAMRSIHKALLLARIYNIKVRVRENSASLFNFV